jgi:general secretion pathway protein E
LHQAIVREVESRFPSQEPARWRSAVGCSHCNHTGYKGRLGIYEMVPVTPALQAAINANATAEQLLKVAAATPGFRTLRDDGLLKARLGHSTIDEVLRVTGLPEDALA